MARLIKINVQVYAYFLYKKFKKLNNIYTMILREINGQLETMLCLEKKVYKLYNLMINYFF